VAITLVQYRNDHEGSDSIPAKLQAVASEENCGPRSNVEKLLQRGFQRGLILWRSGTRGSRGADFLAHVLQKYEVGMSDGGLGHEDPPVNPATFKGQRLWRKRGLPGKRVVVAAVLETRGTVSK